MRKFLFGAMLFVLSLLFIPAVHAQTRLMVGIDGAQDFDNSSLGVSAAIEIPFAKRFEIDLKDTFSPLESHVSLGGGRANLTAAGGRIWITQHWGIVGSAQDSMYDVTKVDKDADYAFGGLTYRNVVGGLPARFSFQYIDQFNNGISPSGLETNHLKGFDFDFTVRFGCLGAICIRNTESFNGGKILEQGNQACDGSLPIVAPNVYCGPRKSAVGGGVTVSVAIEFPRRKGHEFDVF